MEKRINDFLELENVDMILGEEIFNYLPLGNANGISMKLTKMQPIKLCTSGSSLLRNRVMLQR